MEKLRRTERLIIMTKTLLEKPQYLFSLNYFTDLFQTAKSTVSEDLAIIKETFSRFKQGNITTVPGAAGGVKFLPALSEKEINEILLRFASQLTQPERIIPGGFLYMTDLIFDPNTVRELGLIFASRFAGLNPDYIITIETKGIPLALMTAHAFNVPLVIVRSNSRVTEGSSVSINYLSASTRTIQTMSLARRALPKGAKVLIIDDFMKGGGTARGMVELMEEFEAEVLGIGFLIGTKQPEKKLIEKYMALLELEKVDEINREVIIHPAPIQ